MPDEMAELTADSYIGTANYLLGIGGRFVQIRMQSGFYEFTELVEQIEEQNAKNLERIQLDEEDKALIRPVLIQVIKRSSKEVSPETQLATIVVAILIKKIQSIYQIRQENAKLEDNLQAMIEASKNQKASEPAEEPETNAAQEQQDKQPGTPPPEAAPFPMAEFAEAEEIEAEVPEAA